MDEVVGVNTEDIGIVKRNVNEIVSVKEKRNFMVQNTIKVALRLINLNLKLLIYSKVVVVFDIIQIEVWNEKVKNISIVKLN